MHRVSTTAGTCKNPWGQLQLGSNLNCRVVDLLRLTLAMTLHCPGSVGILSIAATKSDPKGWDGQ